MRYRFGDCSLDPELFQLRRGEELVEITRQAFDVLLYLIEQRDRVVPRAELLDHLWCSARGALAPAEREARDRPGAAIRGPPSLLKHG